MYHKAWPKCFLNYVQQFYFQSILKDLLFLSVYTYECRCPKKPEVSDPSDPLELELQAAGSRHVGQGGQGNSVGLLEQQPVLVTAVESSLQPILEYYFLMVWKHDAVVEHLHDRFNHQYHKRKKCCNKYMRKKPNNVQLPIQPLASENKNQA